MLLARIERFNNLSVGQLSGMFADDDLTIESDSDDCSEILGRDLDEDTIHAMEAAFEGTVVFDFPNDKDWDEEEDGRYECGESTPAWRQRYLNDDDRLIAIMERVIANEGKFDAYDVNKP